MINHGFFYLNIFIIMAKLIITESQYNRLIDKIKEDIDPEEALNHNNALQTVINGKRDVGFFGGATKQDFNNLIKSGLKYIKVGKNNAYVFYRDGSEENAQMLASIARKNDGYLPTKTPEETYVIGILLGYHKEKVKNFVEKKFPEFKFY